MIVKLINGALKNRGLVLVGLLGVIGLGVMDYYKLDVEASPDISPIMVSVFAEADGMAPEEVEQLVAYPIETAMNGLPSVTQIKSTSAFGMAVVISLVNWFPNGSVPRWQICQHFMSRRHLARFQRGWGKCSFTILRWKRARIRVGWIGCPICAM